jgi:hypothetical protein
MLFEKVTYGILYETSPGTTAFLARGGGWTRNVNEAASFDNEDDAHWWTESRAREETNGTSIVKITIKVEKL